MLLQEAVHVNLEVTKCHSEALQAFTAWLFTFVGEK